MSAWITRRRGLALKVSVLLCVMSIALALEKGCHNAQSLMGDPTQSRTVVGEVPGEPGIVFDQFTPGHRDSVCDLDSTCCSEEAELTLRRTAGVEMYDEFSDLMSDYILPCYNHSFIAGVQDYLTYSKEGLVLTMLRAYGVLFQPYTTLFDEFFLYLQGAVASGDTCQLGEQFSKVFFKLYVAAYVANPFTPATLPNTEEYRNCFYNYFLSTRGNQISNFYHAFTKSFNRTMYYIRALRTADRVIESILSHQLTQQCNNALLKMGPCSQCAGYSLVDSLPCRTLCLNTMRGCLVDLTTLVQPMREFSEALVRMKDDLEANFDPWTHITLLDYNFLTIASGVGNQITAISQQVATRCGAAGSSSRSSDSKRDAPRVEARNTQMPPPSAEFNHSALCFSEIADGISQLPEQMCNDTGVSLDDRQCWNGRRVGSYRSRLVPFDLSAQQNNREVVICSRQSQVFRNEIALLKHVTKELDILSKYLDCSEDDEDCVVEPLCNFQPPVRGIDGEDFSSSSASLGSAEFEGSTPERDECLPDITPTGVVTSSTTDDTTSTTDYTSSVYDTMSSTSSTMDYTSSVYDTTSSTSSTMDYTSSVYDTTSTTDYTSSTTDYTSSVHDTTSTTSSTTDYTSQTIDDTSPTIITGYPTPTNTNRPFLPPGSSSVSDLQNASLLSSLLLLCLAVWYISY